MARRYLPQPFPVRGVLDPPIMQPDPSWNPRIDLYRSPQAQCRPFQYHNAAIWPWVGGFYVASLVKAGQPALAQKELESLALSNRAGRDNEWEFNEWLHGRTGVPMGATLQSWSASGYIVAYKAVTEGVLP